MVYIYIIKINKKFKLIEEEIEEVSSFVWSLNKHT